QMLDHHLIKVLVIAIRDERLGFLFIVGTRLFNEAQKRFAAVVEMLEPVFDLRRTKRMHVEANVFTVLAVTGAFEGAHLIEGATEIRAAERFVLVKLQSVLIVQMKRPELVERHRKFNFISGIESGEDAMRGFNQATDALRIFGQLRDGERVTNGRNVSVI